MLSSVKILTALLVSAIAPIALASPHNLTARQTSCPCGYLVTHAGTTSYFRFRHIINFDQLTTVQQIRDQGWVVADGWQAGAVNDLTGQVPIGSAANVGIVKGEGVALKVPRQDKNSRQFSTAEIQFPDATLGGIFQITSKLTAVPGSCMGFFTYADSAVGRDEQDVEMLGVSLLKAQTTPYYQPPGIQMTNYRPSDGTPSPAGSSSPFPAGVDPSKAYHTYTISWYPTTSTNNPAKLTEMRFDGKLLNAPKVYSSTNPSHIILNHWTSGDPRFTAGPPTQDAVMYVKKVVAYYDKPAKMAAGTGVWKDTCNKALACKVTI